MKYTVLPWMNAISAGKILVGIAFLLIAWCILEYFIKKWSMNLRRGHLAIMSNTAWALCLNGAICTVAFWRWALILSLAVGILFWIIIRGELKTAREEELEGARGVRPELKEIRSELFADLPIEEQLAFKKNYKPVKLWWWLWLPLMIAIPFLAILLLEQLGAGDYLFHIVYFE